MSVIGMLQQHGLEPSPTPCLSATCRLLPDHPALRECIFRPRPVLTAQTETLIPLSCTFDGDKPVTPRSLLLYSQFINGITARALRFPPNRARVGTANFTEHSSRRFVMKRSRLMISVAFAFFVLLTSAFAQMGVIRVTVPFDFTVGKQTLAAGEDKVIIQGPSLLVGRTDGTGATSVLTNYTGAGPNQDLTPRLVFHGYGNRHFLSAAWLGESDMGHE